MALFMLPTARICLLEKLFTIFLWMTVSLQGVDALSQFLQVGSSRASSGVPAFDSLEAQLVVRATTIAAFGHVVERVEVLINERVQKTHRSLRVCKTDFVAH